MRTGLVSTDRLFRGGNAKGHNYPQVHGSGCPKEMSNSEIISDGFSAFEELCVAFSRCHGFVRKQPFSYKILNSPFQNSLRCAGALRFEGSIE